MVLGASIASSLQAECRGKDFTLHVHVADPSSCQEVVLIRSCAAARVLSGTDDSLLAALQRACSRPGFPVASVVSLLRRAA